MLDNWFHVLPLLSGFLGLRRGLVPFPWKTPQQEHLSGIDTFNR